jgi:molybdopterin-guanine dinucleotide biosynthesis protein A
MPSQEQLPPVTALVLAGGKTGPAFAAAAAVPDVRGGRSLAEINGQPMVRYVLQALQQAEGVDRVVLVAPSGFPDQPEADEVVHADADLVDNIAAGLKHCPGADFVLLVTADIPFITAAAIDDYLRVCREARVDVCYAAIPREACEKQFPNMRRTYLRTRDNAYTGGNVVLQRVSVFDRQAATLREARRRRKSPAFLAKLIGWGNLFKLLTRRLELEDISEAASRLLGVQCKLVVTPWAELGSDVDKPEDLLLARSLLERR